MARKPRLKQGPKRVWCKFLEGPMDGEKKLCSEEDGLGFVMGTGHIYFRETVDAKEFLYLGHEDSEEEWKP